MTGSARAVAALAVALCVSPGLAGGEQPAGLRWPSGELAVERVPSERGVPSEVVTTIYQDREGFVWIGSRSGLALYDGFTYTVFANDPADPTSLSDNPIRTIYEDSGGNLWVGTNAGGLNRLNRATWQFEHYRHDSSDPSSLSHDSVYAVLEDSRGRLWVGTQQGLNLLDRDGARFERFLEPGSGQSSYVTTLLEDRRGRLLVGTVGGGIRVLEPGGTEFTDLVLEGEAAGELGKASVFAIHEDAEGRLLAAVSSGVLVVEPAGDAYYVASVGRLGDSPVEFTVTSLASGPGGTVWIATHGAGLVLFDPATRRTRRFLHDPARASTLSHDTIICVMRDSSGTLWVATWGGGVNRISAAALLLASAPAVAPPDDVVDVNVTSLYRDRSGRLWIGTRSGALLRWDPLRDRVDSFLDGKPRSILAITEDSEGDVWVGTSGELIRVDPRTGATDVRLHDAADPSSPGPGYIRALLQDRAGQLWMGSGEGGLQQIAADGRVVRSFRHDPADPETLSDDYVTVLLEDRRGTIWVGTRSGGLNALDPRQGAVHRFVAEPGTTDAFSHHLVTSILEGDDGSVWVGTGGGGLNRVQRGDDGEFRITHLTRAEGLIDNNVMALLQDDDGSLWISTKAGLSRCQPRSGECVGYERSDGLPSSEFEPGTAARLDDGLYFGSVAWIAAAPAGTPFPTPAPSRTLVREIRTADHGAPRQQPAWEVASLAIPYGQWLSIDLVTLDLAGGRGQAYAYRLGDGESDWIDLGSQRSITFTNLRPGRFRFEARGRNSRGVWSAIDPAIDLRVVPPFWMTGWFRGLLLLLVVAAALTIHVTRLAVVNRRNRVLEELTEQRERARQELDLALQRLRVLARSLEQAKEDERKHVARELHDDMGPALTAVLISLQLVGREPLSDRALRRITETTDLVDRLVARVRDLSLDLRPPLLDEMGLVSSLKGYMETQAERTGQRIVVNDVNVPEHLGPEVEITAFRIAQEAVTNAIRHASADTVTVTLTGRDGRLELLVEDDGGGFDVARTLDSAATGKALGLLGMQERVRMLGGDCDIDSQLGNGTRVRVRLPLELT